MPTAAAADELDYYVEETFDRLSSVSKLLYGRPLHRRSLLAPLPWRPYSGKGAVSATTETRRAAAPLNGAAAKERRIASEDVILTLDMSNAAAKCETALKRAEKMLQRFEQEAMSLQTASSQPRVAYRQATAIFDAADFSVGLVIMASHVALNSEASGSAHALWKYRSDEDDVSLANAYRGNVFALLVEGGRREAAVELFSHIETALLYVHGASSRPGDLSLSLKDSLARTIAVDDASLHALPPWVVRYLEELVSLATSSADGTPTPSSTPQLSAAKAPMTATPPPMVAVTPAEKSPVIPLTSEPASQRSSPSRKFVPIPLADDSTSRLGAGFEDSTPTSVASTAMPLSTLLQSSVGENPLSASTDSHHATSVAAAPHPTPDIPGLLKYEPGMTRAEVAEALTAFYTTYNPPKLSDLQHIVTAFDGRYPQLFNALNHKYLNVATEFVDPHYRAPLPVLVTPLEYRRDLTVAEAVGEVAEFYQRVAPMKTSHAAAVVDRHRDDIEKLYFLLNRKYLEGFGEPLPLEANGFDTAARTQLDVSVDQALPAAGDRRTDGRSSQSSSASSSTLPPDTPPPPSAAPAAPSSGGGSWCLVM